MAQPAQLVQPARKARLARKASLDETARRLQEEAREAQQRDALTALPGRELFGQRLAVTLKQAPAENLHSIGLVCLGLDGFSKVNDSLGAAVGDKVLYEVACRLGEHMRDARDSLRYDCVARLGSDLFAVYIGENTNLTALEESSAALLQVLAQPYLVDGHTLFLTACAGASLFPMQAADAHGLLLNAETALHHAKPVGPGTVRVFDTAMNLQVARRLQVHNALHAALEQNELQVYYQPQVSIAAGNVVGFEALLRWHHPQRGTISPNIFIPMAERSGLNPIATSIAAVIATGAPKPARDSRRPPKQKAISRARTRGSSLSRKNVRLRSSKRPETTVMSYIQIAVRRIQTIGNSP